MENQHDCQMIESAKRCTKNEPSDRHSILSTMSANDIDGYNSGYIACEKKEIYVTIKRSRSLNSSCSTSKYGTLTHVRIRNSISSDQTNKQPIKYMNKNGTKNTIAALDQNSISRLCTLESTASNRKRARCHNRWKCGSKMFLKNEKVKIQFCK